MQQPALQVPGDRARIPNEQGLRLSGLADGQANCRSKLVLAKPHSDGVRLLWTQDEDLVRLFSDGALDPELADAVTAVRVVRTSVQPVY